MKIIKILETCLYVDDLEKSEHFYSTVIGLELLTKEEGRHVFFRCGNAVFLLFNPEKTMQPGQDVPVHGAYGNGHVAFAISENDYDIWKSRLIENGVEIETEINWPRGGKSIYFRDPSGNSIELATQRVWGIENE